jgi:hypothetical protein
VLLAGRGGRAIDHLKGASRARRPRLRRVIQHERARPLFERVGDPGLLQQPMKETAVALAVLGARDVRRVGAALHPPDAGDLPFVEQLCDDLERRPGGVDPMRDAAVEQPDPGHDVDAVGREAGWLDGELLCLVTQARPAPRGDRHALPNVGRDGETSGVAHERAEVDAGVRRPRHDVDRERLRHPLDDAERADLELRSARERELEAHGLTRALRRRRLAASHTARRRPCRFGARRPAPSRRS